MHRIEREEGPLPYAGPVHPEQPNPAAHGGVRFIRYREDGATQEVVVNGRHREAGPWTSSG